MADFDRNVLEFYQLSTPFPTEWPAEKDKSDDSDSEQEQLKKQKINRRKSRYQALERAVSNRTSIVQGSEKSPNGVSNLVQKDEPDPLGTSDSVVRSLKQLGVPVQDDVRLRNRFLLSSTSFSPALFLSQMHATADTQSLLNGLDVLSKSIDQKSASLKVLVESNFERFVRAKATIDNVYKEMKYRGVEPPSLNRARRHSRQASRSSFRNSSGGAALGTNPLVTPLPDTRKKNALVKESDYGVMGIKTPLLDVAAKAEDVWGPALGGREKEENLKTVSSSLDRYKEYIEASSNIADSIKRKDYEALVEEYTRARRFADEARKLVEELGSTPPSETEAYQILLAARMWYDVGEQIQLFKRELWRKLTSLHNASRTDTLVAQPQDQHMELISLLLELGVDDNPIWVWLLSKYDYLKGKISSLGERAKVEIEVLRRRLANGEKPPPQMMATHLRNLGRLSVEGKANGLDSSDVIELWEKMLAFLSSLLSSQGVLGEVIEFWQTVEGFIDGKAQKALPTGYNGESRDHHRLSQQGTVDLQKGTIELVDMIRGHVFEFFAGAPPEDVSLLFSPLPPSPGTPGSAGLSNTRDPRFNFDANNLPPPSPKTGEAWEKFAFWPPTSNSVSGVHYLSRMLNLVGSGASEMASIAPVRQGDAKQLEMLKTLVGAARERCVTALCAAWNKDAENIKYVEDWKRSKEMGDITRMPTSFASFEGALLSGMQKILYIPEAMAKPGSGDIVSAPTSKLLQMVRSQYVTTLYKALSGMVENAERAIKKTDDEWTTDADLTVRSGSDRVSLSLGSETVDPGDRNVRMLLTLGNLHALRTKVVPNLNSQFENAFSVKLTDESKTIKDVLGQIDARLFQSFTRPSLESLRKIIRAGLSDPKWAPPKPTEVKPYVYEALLTLVLVHTQVSTTAPSMTHQVLSYLLEQVSRELLESLKARPRFDLGALMQATLDVEFFAQTLSQYTTERASAIQGEIYTMLDSKTDNQARARLQDELPGMREVLKKLREHSRAQFACFKRPRRAAPGQGSVSLTAAGGVGVVPGIERTATG
ncbi:exocyst complex component Sec5-domain-containing protein [Daldinia caldariorum]|uniref:exocyst complex component Sec5-domain-containing protein n=1 Tax=Daldinia caldariorum TaxID=326644 RepID=UPI002007BF64|nr:exocyst complex component Sec5-domain-containing protein [Daldinia caldariorum]KAI1470216.1 exocyst complex component Sec5-domain-containing protein [Daldinia caldariorum]